MTITSQTADTMDLELDSVIRGLKKEDIDLTNSSLKKLTSQQNAYTCTTNKPSTKWNMITYKNGQKSSL